MLERGYLTVARMRGVPIRIHWTTPVGAVLFGHLRFVPAFWIAFFVIVLVHELGHAALVWRFRYRVISIDVAGYGGMCRWQGHASPVERGVIAWGGVLAQAAVFIVALVLALVGFWSLMPGGTLLASALLWTNLMIIGLNLLPFPPLDGNEAWSVLPLLFRRGQARREGREVWRQVLAQPGPQRRTVHRRTPSPPETTTTPGEDDAVKRELADMLRNVADEASRARRNRERN